MNLGVRDLNRDRGHTRFEIVVSVLLIVFALGILYLYNLDGWLINDDEGSFLYQAWRMSEGDKPYQELFSSRWPLFLHTGATWMRIFGPAVVPMRLLSVCLTLGTGLIVFLIARLFLPVEASLLGMLVFLLSPDSFQFGRAFQPEPFYIFFSTLGLYFAARGQAKRNLSSFFCAGAIFAVASMYKLLSVLVLLGCLISLGATWLRNQESRRSTVCSALALLLPFGLLSGIVAGAYLLGVPDFYQCVIGVNLAQGRELPLSSVAIKGVAFLTRDLIISPLFLLALPAAWWGWRNERQTALLSWQLPTALGFVVLSRDLFPRLLFYLLPSLAVLFAASLEPVRLLPRRSLLLLAIVASVIVPWAVDDAGILVGKEDATMRVAQYIEAHTDPDALVLSDYQELNFYALRSSTYSGAEISQVIVAGAAVTGAGLISEIEAADVSMVIIDVSQQTGHHLVHLRDYVSFRAYLQQHFDLLAVLPRNKQMLEVYARKPHPNTGGAP
jgi:4-amino-4-deoxy-L-arabinose transferase-like glycosyltransferase